MSIKERKEREKQEMQSLILDAAMNLFLEEGFENVTIRKIAEKIEYSPGTVYLYFNDKDDILYALHFIGFELFYQRQIETAEIKNPLERLYKLSEEYIRFSYDFPQYYELMFIQKSPMKKIKENEIWECGFRTYNVFKECIGDCIKQKKIKLGEVESLTFMIWSLLHGISSLKISERLNTFPEGDLNTIIDNGIKQIIGLLSK